MNKAVAVFVLFLAVLSTAVGCSSGADKIDMQIGVDALAALADSHISSYVSSFESLRLTDEVQSGDWEAMEPLLAKVAHPESAAAVWFVLPDGSYSTVSGGAQTANLSDRDYFPKLLAGQTVLGDLVVSKSTGRKSAVVAVPVMQGQQVIGALGASVFLDDLSDTLRGEMGLPNDVVFAAVASDGEIALHSDTAMIMADDPGLPTNVKSKTSSLTGWVFSLGTK